MKKMIKFIPYFAALITIIFSAGFALAILSNGKKS
jgi:hypothetical protein